MWTLCLIVIPVFNHAPNPITRLVIRLRSSSSCHLLALITLIFSSSFDLPPTRLLFPPFRVCHTFMQCPFIWRNYRYSPWFTFFFVFFSAFFVCNNVAPIPVCDATHFVNHVKLKLVWTVRLFHTHKHKHNLSLNGCCSNTVKSFFVSYLTAPNVGLTLHIRSAMFHSKLATQIVQSFTS